ncbi:MAG TPA: 6-phosphogluconolactonase [Elusimicrobiota bacterium]|nr:6-phosphogluconolactonase [Elusimicrobiota bacterium]
MKPEVLRFPAPREMILAAAEGVVGRATSAAKARGRFVLALSGGSTPRPLHETLAAAPFVSRMPWDKTVLFWGDERCVPPADPASNYAMARQTLLDRLPRPPLAIARMEAERGAAPAAAAYEDVLRRLSPDGIDLALLGLGEDGHTASLFPGDPALDERERLAAPVSARGNPRVDRVTLTFPAFRAARAAFFLTRRPGKERALDSILAGSSGLPAARVAPRETLTWFISES